MASCTPVELAYNSIDPKDGAEDKDPIIFLHGMGGSKEHWKHVTQPVADAMRRKVYAIDARNHGDTAWSDVFNFDVNVDDFLHFMDTMNIPKAIFVGHSMGGITAIKTALRVPERVEKLVVEDIGVEKPPQSLLNCLLGMFHMTKAAVEGIPVGVDEQTAYNHIIEAWKDQIPPELQAKIKTDPTEFPMQLKRNPDGRYTFKANFYSFENALKNWDSIITEPEGVYEGPTCFIYGKLSEWGKNLDPENNKQFFPNAEFVGIETNHNVHFESLQEFLDVLLKFLKTE